MADSNMRTAMDIAGALGQLREQILGANREIKRLEEANKELKKELKEAHDWIKDRIKEGEESGI